ncbi:DNA-directed RNA polymerase subunit alpha [Candidatus Marinamargulisbacteria bacterium SCGC AG-343-D04]|nr:DNA-directed RNA polymerase subunit alpha [Candidatus Marinamargulisbacteria bacterium SCGC AG-343-D04]
MSTEAWVRYEKAKTVDDVRTLKGVFTIGPLQKGMGITLGNSLRRVLLSSLPGSAMTSLKINGVPHEFSTIDNVKEDVLEIVCNLKTVIYKKTTDNTEVVSLKLDGKKKVYASDIVCPTGVEVVNSDQFLFEITDKANVDINISIDSGYGYLDCQTYKTDEIDRIKTDASFSPIVKVNHHVNSIRVGKELDFESLVLEVETNGTIDPEDAMKYAVNVLVNHMELFDRINEEPEIDKTQEEEFEDLKLQSILKMTIDELELSARSSNCLKRAGIENVSELLEKDMSELVHIKNFGKKSADEINSRLSQFNLSLKGTEEAEEQV